MSEAAPVPKRIGRYDLGEAIAKGGMATVYLARAALGGNRMVALKVLHDELAEDPEQVRMFLDEATLLRRLAHPSTVQLYETGEDEGRHFIAMELLIGDSLLRVWRALQKHQQRMSYEMAAYIGARVGEGLHHAHELRSESGLPLNVVHRDVNPANIHLTFDGRVKVIDFGLAKSSGTGRASHTAQGVVKGKIAYLSPEQIEGKPADRRADVFALGTTLWEITVDRRLFKQDNDVETVRAIHKCDVPDPRRIRADYPPNLWAVLRRALARDPADRYPTAADLARDLDEVINLLGAKVGPPTLSKLMGQIVVWGASDKPPPPQAPPPLPKPPPKR